MVNLKAWSVQQRVKATEPTTFIGTSKGKFVINLPDSIYYIIKEWSNCVYQLNL